MNEFKYYGVDGCTSGWICAGYDGKTQWKVKIYSSFSELANSTKEEDLILIDIPIGLRDQGGEPRLCDRAAREYLTRKRSSSIFPTPCRAVLKAENYQQANALNRMKTGKGLSKQSWNITSKIKEVDSFLQAHPEKVDKIIESHPEACFAALNEGKPMDYYKKKPEGKKERISLLNTYVKGTKQFIEIKMKEFTNKEAVDDDLFDAICLSLSASGGYHNWRFLPESYEFDSVGLPMRIAIPDCSAIIKL